jgi:uroporphyrinogen decarboxylase
MEHTVNSIERFYATVERRPVDRPASWLGIPDHHALPALFSYFGVKGMEQLKRKIGDDIWPVEVPYKYPPANHIACAFDFTMASDYDERTLTHAGWFADKTDPACVKDFSWPDPKKHMSVEACRKAIDEVPEGFVKLGVLWSAHFQDACAAFGMENAMMVMLTEPEMFQAVIDRITGFYLEANEIFYQAAEGRVEAVLIGNDFGSQTGLMVSPDLLREFVFPGTKKLIDQAHSYGMKVIHHSCGAVRKVIPDLVEVGADVIHPIQALATGMEPQGLHDGFSDTVAFCGGVDAQNLLVNGSVEQVREKVKELRRIFPTGLIISPSHEAILPDIPPENIAALFGAAQLKS